MFWMGFIVGLLAPVAFTLLVVLGEWLFAQGTRVTCTCGKVYGVMHRDVRDGLVDDNNEPHKRPTLDRVTDLQVLYHQLFHCPRRKAVTGGYNR